MAGNSGNERNLSKAALNLHEATEAESRASCQLLAHRQHHKAVRLDGWMRMGIGWGRCRSRSGAILRAYQVRDAGCAVQRHGAPCHPAAPLRVHAFRDREKRWDRGGDFGGAEERFFVKVEEGYRVNKAVRDMCVFAQGLKQPGTERDVPIAPTLALLDVQHHPPAVDVGDLQVSRTRVLQLLCCAGKPRQYGAIPGARASLLGTSAQAT
jgi:hypothetical protein